MAMCTYWLRSKNAKRMNPRHVPEPLLHKTLRALCLSLTSPSHHTNTWCPTRMNTSCERAKLVSMSQDSWTVHIRILRTERGKPISSTLPLVARAEGPNRGGARTAGRTREEHRGLCGEMDVGYIATGLWVTRMSCLPKLSELYTGDLDILPNVSGAEK